MALMNVEMYDALREAGASEEKARAAASSVASYDARFATVEGDLRLVKWMLGFNLTMTAAILYRVFAA